MNPTAANDTVFQEIAVNASAERVFDAFADPRRRLRWWRSTGLFQATDMESDLRPGGVWMMRGIGRDARPFTVRGEYLEVERPRLVVFTWIRGGNEDPTESTVRVEFGETSGVTTVRLAHSGLVTEALRARNNGWPLILSLMQTYIEQDSSAAV